MAKTIRAIGSSDKSGSGIRKSKSFSRHQGSGLKSKLNLDSGAPRQADSETSVFDFIKHLQTPKLHFPRQRKGTHAMLQIQGLLRITRPSLRPLKIFS